jgi:hypothetical protein
MKNELLIESADTKRAAQSSRKRSPFLQLAEGCSHPRAIRIAFRLVRTESAATARSVLAELRQTELQNWIATGADFLAST